MIARRSRRCFASVAGTRGEGALAVTGAIVAPETHSAIQEGRVRLATVPAMLRHDGIVGDDIVGMGVNRASVRQRPREDVSIILESRIDDRGFTEQRSLMNIDHAALQLEALGHTTRLKVFRTLARAGRSGLSVRALQDEVGTPASTLSHHLHRLIVAGLVVQQRQATTLTCLADLDAMGRLVGFLNDAHDDVGS